MTGNAPQNKNKQTNKKQQQIVFFFSHYPHIEVASIVSIVRIQT